MMFKTALRNKAVVPLVGLVGIALGSATGFGTWFLLKKPDVFLDKQRRMSVLK